jgi:hypothetical protein
VDHELIEVKIGNTQNIFEVFLSEAEAYERFKDLP